MKRKRLGHRISGMQRRGLVLKTYKVKMKKWQKSLCVQKQRNCDGDTDH